MDRLITRPSLRGSVTAPGDGGTGERPYARQRAHGRRGRRRGAGDRDRQRVYR